MTLTRLLTRTIGNLPTLRSLRTAVLAVTLLAPALALPSTASAESWSVDPSHTEINFAVDHFFTPVNGSFEEFEVDLEYDPDQPGQSRVSAKIAVDSVDTGNRKRDDHLRSADWFEAEEHPYMTFESTSVRAVGDQRLVADGVLTIKGQEKRVLLPITLLGSREIPPEMQEMLGGSKEVSSFRAETSVDRGEFGVGVGSWAATAVVGGEVDIEILLEAHRR